MLFNQFNVDECHLMHSGRSNLKAKYYVNDEELSVVDFCIIL